VRDVAVMVADGGDCVTDLEALRGQERLFRAVASQTTAHRVLKSIDEGLLDELRRVCAGVGRGRAPADDHARHRRDDPDRALGEGAGGGHLQAVLLLVLLDTSATMLITGGTFP
jgi:hypothetical protein